MRVPIIALDSSNIGPLGITLDAPDSGGANGQAGRAIPVLQPRMADERQWCTSVVRSIHEGITPRFQECGAYRCGRCALAGGKTLCAFLEPPERPVWSKARDWYYLEGVGLVHRLLWSQHGITAGGA